MLEDVLVPLGAFTMITALVLGVPLVRALAKRWERESVTPRVPAELHARLERLEQSVDAIAIEVERMSEGQRFVTKLLADRVPARAGEPAPLSGGGPHKGETRDDY